MVKQVLLESVFDGRIQRVAVDSQLPLGIVIIAIGAFGKSACELGSVLVEEKIPNPRNFSSVPFRVPITSAILRSEMEEWILAPKI
jgi:hypothetical protein